ncbi:hypothetical protein FXO38_08681 [Capsicum annuum]|nr:hypothetical protein FXO37_18411 [Capsicum annuum]KAF3667285.1 hypothetical protein FXO38_08681 [Capsicum annuum]
MARRMGAALVLAPLRGDGDGILAAFRRKKIEGAEAAGDRGGWSSFGGEEDERREPAAALVWFVAVGDGWQRWGHLVDVVCSPEVLRRLAVVVTVFGLSPVEQRRLTSGWRTSHGGRRQPLLPMERV